jgi:hypothetical protein
MNLEQAGKLAEEFATDGRSASDLRSYLIVKHSASASVVDIAVRLFLLAEARIQEMDEHLREQATRHSNREG